MERTGFFANTLKITKIHIANENTKPICGSIIGKDMNFQCCANRVHLDYVECEKCSSKFKREIPL